MIVVPRGVCKNILSGRRGGSAVNIFVVLLGNVQWSFLMGTTACQGEKLPLPPHLLCWDTGSHPKDEETAPVTPVLGETWADRHSALQRGSRGRCCLLLQATGIFPQATSLPRSQLHPRGDFRIGQALIRGMALPAGWRAACLLWVRVCNADTAAASRPPIPAVPAWAAPGTHRGLCVTPASTLPHGQPHCQQAEHNPGSQGNRETPPAGMQGLTLWMLQNFFKGWLRFLQLQNVVLRP